LDAVARKITQKQGGRKSFVKETIQKRGGREREREREDNKEGRRVTMKC
jgi:hypothetical protein